MQPICQTQSIVELRFSSVKIKQLRRFGRFYLLRVSTSKRSPKRMQLSLIVGIAFGSWLISDLPISGWSGFPYFRFSIFPRFNISGLRVNLHLTLQTAGLKCRSQVRSQVTGHRSGYRSHVTDQVTGHKKTIGHWTKLFWTDVLLYKNKISQIPHIE